ncbi:MAG: hypothetical protein ACI808_001158 [Paraglaciecola sp.]|jgi:hypothetical protein
MSNNKVAKPQAKLGADTLAKSEVPDMPVVVVAGESIPTSVTEKYLLGYTLVLEHGKALTLSPKTQKHVFYQIATQDDDGSLHIRLSGNEGGGLHSKEWLSVKSITDLLDSMENQQIKSTVLKPVFKGGSANNAAFLAAVLRSDGIGLLSQSDKSVFIHQLSVDYAQRKEALIKLANGPAD